MNALMQFPYRSALFFLLVPLAVLLLVQNDLTQAGGLDAYIYAAYSNDYSDLISRYTQTYYSTRLSHILPNAIASAALGDHAGYLFFRYLLLVAATIATYAIARHYANELTAWFMALFICAHVWLLRELFWDYYDGSVVTYALVGIALLLPRKDEAWAHFGAGFAFAWAGNGNPMGLAIAVTYAPTWFIERSGRPLLTKLRSMLAAIAGFAIGYSALIVAMLQLYPAAGWNFDRVTMGMLSFLMSGGGTNWFMSLSDLIFTRLSYEPLILPFFTIISALGVYFANPDDPAMRRRSLGALVFMLATASVFCIFHFVLNWGVVGLHYYLIYALPACLVALSALIGQWKPTINRPVAIAIAVFFSMQFAFWFNAHHLFSRASGLIRPSDLFSPVVISLMVLAVGGLLFLAVAARKRRKGLVSFSTVLLVLFSSNVFFVDAFSTQIFRGDDREVEWDVRDGALYLQRFIAKRVPTQDPVRFWYGTRDGYLNSVQSVHLWAFSRLSAPAASEAQMPMIDGAVKERLLAAKYVAILGTEAEIDAAFNAISAAGFVASVIDRGEFNGRQWPGYKVLLIAIKPTAT